MAAFAAAAGLAAGLWGSPAAPRGDYRVIATADFDIVFPEPAARAAARLAARAEGMLAELEAWFPKPAGRRLPVVITLDEMDSNAYFADLPYPRIMLYAAPPSLSSTIGAFDDYLLRLFRHELIHALSLLQRDGAYDLLAFFFGDSIAPAFIGAPAFMREGPTVSLEGGGGPAGRTADPLIAHYIRQDLVEGRFKTPAECWSAYGRYPGGNLYYFYGGYFSAWLQREFGMEQYARLWKELGSGRPFELLGGGAFRAAYGMGLDEAWAAFGESMRPRGELSMDIRPVAGVPRGLYSAMAPLGGMVVYKDQERNAVFLLDPATGKEEFLFDADWTVEGLHASVGAGPRAGRLIVDSGSIVDGRLRLGARVFDLAARRFEATWIEGAQEACATEGGYIAVIAGAFQNDLVMVEGGARKVVARGGSERRFSDLRYAGGRYAYCLACQGTERLVLRVDVGTGRVEKLSAGRSLAYARWLSEGPGGSLLLSLPGDDGFYRLARLGAAEGDDPALSLRVERRARSGAVSMPVAYAGGVAYRGLFSAGQSLMVHPDPGLSDADSFDASWVAWDIPAEDAAGDGALASPPPSTPYSALSYTWPRLVIPSLSYSGGEFTLGATFMGMDPTENIDWRLEADWLWGSDFVDISARINGLSFRDSAGAAARYTGLALAGSASLPLFPSWRAFVLEGGLGLSAVAPAAAGSPYTWTYSRSAVSAWGEAGFVSLPGRAYADSAEPSGFALYLSLVAARPTDAPAAAALSAIAELYALGKLGPLEARLSASWAPGMSMSSGGWAGYSSGAYSFGLGARYGGIPDYSLPDAGVEWLAKGELSLKLLELPADAAFLQLLYLGSLRLDAFYRASLYGGSYSQSAGARLAARAGLLYPSLGSLLPLGAELGWAFGTGELFFRYSLGF